VVRLKVSHVRHLPEGSRWCFRACREQAYCGDEISHCLSQQRCPSFPRSLSRLILAGSDTRSIVMVGSSELWYCEVVGTSTRVRKPKWWTLPRRVVAARIRNAHPLSRFSSSPPRVIRPAYKP